MFHPNYLRSLNRAIAQQAGWTVTEKEKRQPNELDVDDTITPKTKISKISGKDYRFIDENNCLS